MSSDGERLIQASEEVRILVDEATEFIEAKLLNDPCLLMLLLIANRFPVGTDLNVAHDGFSGTVQGYYRTREGRPGLVLQMHGNKVVHVYSEKWFQNLGP